MTKLYTLITIITLTFAVNISAQTPVTTRSLTWKLTGSKNWPVVSTGVNWDNKANWNVTGTNSSPATNVSSGDKLIIPNVTALNILVTSDMTITYNNIIIEIDGAGEIDIQSGVDMTLSGANTAINLVGVTSGNGLTLEQRASSSNPTRLILNGIVKALNASNSALTITSTTSSNALGTSSLVASSTSYGGFINGILPVVLTDFNINLTTDKKVAVSWITQQEINADRFEVERSADGMNWQTIGVIKASGYSSLPVKYGVADASPIKGVNFYRIHMIDIDGKAAFSQVKNVLLNNTNKISLYPNPTSDVINVSLGTVATADWSIALVNNSGQVITQKKLDKNVTTASVAVNNYPSGNYSVLIIDGPSVQNNKIMITHH